MIIIYEKLIETEEGQDFVECPQEEATHKHYCYNDEAEPRPCRREVL